MSDINKTEKKKEIKPWLLFFLMALLIIILWSGAWILQLYSFSDWPERGQFGDMFGAITSLFSGLAFAGVIIAIYMQKQELSYQRKELELQREELKLTREEIRGQKEQLEAQVLIQKKQNVDNSFFKLLGIYNDYKDNTGWPSANDFLSGLSHFYRNQFLKNFNKSVPVNKEFKINELVRSVYEQYYRPYALILDKYFNTLISILKLVHKSDIPEKQKYFYIDTLKGNMNKDEMSLLYYHGITKKSIFQILDYFEFFNDLPNENLLNTSHHQLYPHLVLNDIRKDIEHPLSE